MACRQRVVRDLGTTEMVYAARYWVQQDVTLQRSDIIEGEHPKPESMAIYVHYDGPWVHMADADSALKRAFGFLADRKKPQK